MSYIEMLKIEQIKTALIIGLILYIVGCWVWRK